MTTVRYRRLSVRFRPRALLVGTACLLLAVAVSVALIAGGDDYPLSYGAVLRTLTGGGDFADTFVVTELRLPRVVTALLVGAALAVGGTVFQTLVRNPLGSPDILGLTQGASSGALVALIVVGAGGAILAAGAVLGGLLTGAAIHLLARRGRTLSGYRLILVGIGVSAMLTGVNGYLLTRANIVDAARAMLWLTGSLDGRDWADVVPLAVAMLVLFPVLLWGTGRALSMLDLGDDAAAALGVRVEPVRLTTLAGAVALVAFAAAAAGPVAFVALTAPQIARRLTGTPGPNLLPTALVGAALMVAADFAATRFFGDRQLPVGVVTGILGGCYLVWLLATQRRAGRI